MWTVAEGPNTCGLTVASVIATEGDRPHVLSTVGDLTELLGAMRVTRRFVVHELAEADRGLPERFVGATPVPGGLLRDLTLEPGAYGLGALAVGSRACWQLRRREPARPPVLVDGGNGGSVLFRRPVETGRREPACLLRQLL